MNKLYVVSTPIGNLEDITIRAIKTLLSVPVIACEDTRHTGILIKLIKEKYSALVSSWQLAVSSPKRFISVRDWNEEKQVIQVIQELQVNDVALVSDAGTPLISDPGYKVVNTVRAAGFEVIPIPGVSAVITALSVAGLPTDKFKFWGFYSDKYDLDEEATNVFYESPIRIEETVKKIGERYQKAEIVIANEMTKIHEQFLKPDEMGKIRGEVTCLVSFGRKK